MQEMNIKNLLGLILRNKQTITSLMDRFDPSDIEKGILDVPELVINRDIKMLAMEIADPYIEDYSIQFQNGFIFLDLVLWLKQLGKIRVKYRITIEDFSFNSSSRVIKCSYLEDLKSEGNFMQAMAIKAAGLKGPYLKSAVELGKLDFMRVDGNKFILNVDNVPHADKIPPSLSLIYNGCEDGIISFDFDI